MSHLTQNPHTWSTFSQHKQRYSPKHQNSRRLSAGSGLLAMMKKNQNDHRTGQCSRLENVEGGRRQCVGGGYERADQDVGHAEPQQPDTTIENMDERNGVDRQQNAVVMLPRNG